MQDEPRKHWMFLVLAGLASIGAVPFWFVGRPTTLLAGGRTVRIRRSRRAWCRHPIR